MAPTATIDFAGQKESKKSWLGKPMGKSRKYSKGQSAGFVPDYRHAVETMAESEGFGSSGRVDTEMTASEDSCAPKRKCISLNVDGYDSFGVPMQVLSLSKMSRPQRKGLECRLKKELEQVRVLQRRVAAFSSSAVVLSPSSDIHSCSDGQKRPSLEGAHRPLEVSAPQNKKRGPPGRNLSCAKKGCVEPVKALPASTSGSVLMKQCETLLNRLMSHQYGWVFNTPVDVVKLNVPDYFTIIKHPMDLGTVKTKLTSSQYPSPLEFAADVRLTFVNAKKYNPPGNDVHLMAETLGKFFEVRWKAIGKKLPVTIDSESVLPGGGGYLEVETSMDTIPSKKTKIKPSDNGVNSEPVRQVMTDLEKHKLSTDLMESMGELPMIIVKFLKAHCNPEDQTGEDEIELDMDALSNDTLFKLRKLLDDHLLNKQKNQGKAEPCEMELRNESGISNSSLQLCKGNEAVEEEVDVVGQNDPPVSSFPPLQIEKDEAHKQTKCSSSSSSSSGSGSSSSGSDSDSASLSGGDADAAEVMILPDATKENLVSGINLDEQKSGNGDSDTGIQPANVFAQDDSTQCKPIAEELPDNQEGEIALPERRVSPDKAYRAAILRSRFADTILKAREKALEKGEKRDPEKLRLEREELERHQKEEKARLQAEARAAEEARRKVEAEAAAEARRKRELEREAARQALQQMEKTVDINENSQFMKDLELLRTARDQQGPSFMEAASPDPSQNGLGSFMLQGTSNPLEQLGLYMKDDDDDDDEEVEPPQTLSEPVKDVEEGEID